MSATFASTEVARSATLALRWRSHSAGPAAHRRRPDCRPIFTPRTEAQLYALTDDDLVRYIAEAKRADARDAAITAMHLLLYKREGWMRNEVGKHMPRHLAHHQDVVADWVIDRVTRQLLKLPLRGESAGEFVNYCKRAISKRWIDFFRTTQGKTLEREAILPSERQGEDGAPVDRLGEDLDVDALADRLDLLAITDRALASMTNPDHVAIVRRRLFDDQPSRQVAEEFGTSPDNVDQIASRFRKTVRAECEAQGVRR